MMNTQNSGNVIKYPRGFKGINLGHVSKVKNNNKQFDLTAIGGMGFPNPVNTKLEPFNEQIESVYTAMLNNKPGVLGMEFRELVYQLFLQTFGNGTISVKDFIMMQVRNGKISEFIDDTFKYILTGQRDLLLPSWNEILTDTNMVEIELDKANYVKEYLSSTDGTPETLIQKWCSNQNGFFDMLYTMRILYGDE